MHGGSGKFFSGLLFSPESSVKAMGPTLHIDGYTQPQFVSQPADSSGRAKFEIPKCVIDANKPQYLIVEGMFQSKPVLRTWWAPATTFIGGPSNTDLLVHFFQNQDDNKGARGLTATALAAKSIIPSAATFAANYIFMYGVLLEPTGDVGFSRFKGYTIQVSVPSTTGGADTVLDNTNCKPDMQCCVYYGSDVGLFVANPTGTLIDTTATASNGSFVVVCPGTQTGEITLTQTAPLANLQDQNNQAPSKPFAPIKAPRVLGDGILLDWHNL